MARPSDRSWIPPLWANDPELLHHLELEPYLKLRVPFDREACLQEALALLNRFVPHRSYDQSDLSGQGGQWKSLALQAHQGDPTKTCDHSDYGAETANYRLTEIAALCPNTMEFLRNITDLSQCERVRFMLMEPGAKIHPHSDAPEKDTQIALNIALNMPLGCEFWLDTHLDGKHHAYSRLLPFEPGDLMLLNIAKYHYVENRSATPRIHLIVHGPIRFTRDELISVARKQNEAHDHRQLLAKLVAKKMALGTLPTQPTEHFSELMKQNSGPDLFPTVRFLIVDHFGADDKKRQEWLERVSYASLVSMKPQIVPLQELDSALKKLSNEIDFAAIVFAGTWIESTNEFLSELALAAAKMKRDRAVVAAHLTNRQDDEGWLPYLHEQFTLVNLPLWRELGHPSFGRPKSGEVQEFPGFQASEENVHHDYTPVLLQPAPHAPATVGRRGFGTQVLAKALHAGACAQNLSNSFRAAKTYAYPNEETNEQQTLIRTRVAKLLAESESSVFYFNNEPLFGMQLSGFQPKHLIAVAAGFKSFALLERYFREAPTRITIVDRSAKATEYFSGLLKCERYSDLIEYIWAFNQAHDQKMKSIAEVKTNLAELVRTGFAGDSERLLRTIRTLKECRDLEIISCDFIADPAPLLKRFRPGEPFLFWHSNSWGYIYSHYQWTRAELQNNYAKLVQNTAALTGYTGHAKEETHESAEALFRDRKGTVAGYFLNVAGSDTPFRYDTFVSTMAKTTKKPEFWLRRYLPERINSWMRP